MRPPPANALVNQSIILALCLLVFAGTLGLGAVWVRQEIYATANRSRALELKYADVARRLDEVDAEVAAALNPDALLRRNQVMRLGLVAPQEIQVVRIAESPEIRLAAKRNRDARIFAASLGGGAPGTAASPVSFRIVTAAYR